LDWGINHELLPAARHLASSHSGLVYVCVSV
jgi:hypothetical protein